jgi:DnaJ-class molecular chaperone
MLMATIKKAVKKVVKKVAAKVIKKKVEKKVVLTECTACNGRGLETPYTLCRHCHGSGRV